MEGPATVVLAMEPSCSSYRRQGDDEEAAEEQASVRQANEGPDKAGYDE